MLAVNFTIKVEEEDEKKFMKSLVQFNIRVDRRVKWNEFDKSVQFDCHGSSYNLVNEFFKHLEDSDINSLLIT